MAVVRRLYVYAIAGITLAMLVGALITLANLALEIALGASAPLFSNREAEIRAQLSLLLATIAVALPVWAIHWALAERSVRATAATAASERSSAIRALFLTLVLLALLGVLIASGAEILRYVLTALLASQPERFALASALAALLVAGSFWLYHARVRLRDLHTPMEGAAAWLPRVYRYWAMFLGLSFFLFGVTQLITLAGDALASPSAGPLIGDSGVAPRRLVEPLTSLAVGAIVFLAHWGYANRLLDAPDWRARSERVSQVRGAYFVLVVLVGVGVALAEVGAALTGVLRVMLGVPEADDLPTTLRNVVGMLVIAFVFAGTWWAHRAALIGERRRLGPEQAGRARRADLYTVALVAIAGGATGIAWLVGLAIEVLGAGADRLAVSDPRAAQLALYLSAALVGTGVWLLAISVAQRRRAADLAAEAGSTARRAYLLLTIAGSLLAAVSALVLILNRFLGTLLGARVSGSLTGELATPLGVLLVAALLGALHFAWFRRDERLVAASRALEVPAAAEVAASAPAVPLVLRLVLTAPAGSDAATAVAGLRAALPEGYRLDEAG